MRAGLEIHQQLATGKLFCECPAELSEEVSALVTRRLRATGGEDHVVDVAARFQAERNLLFHYEATPTSCLVDMDEEPPHPLNRDAIEVALRVSLALGAHPVDEIQVMRKIVVDGSNTTGFQRTALVATGGRLSIGGRSYSIPSICLEEDAARKVSEKTGEIRYRLDRLGMPLIEIATGPEITNGEEAREVAEEIGALLRATGRARRGIGTIREDVNVSAEGGARVEIKGVQQLRLISRYVNGEERRQKRLLEVAAELTRRNACVPRAPPSDVTRILDARAAGSVTDTIRKGGVALALGLIGFAGLLRAGVGGGEERLGRELADHARTTGLRGLVHSDELPTAGIGAEQEERIRAELKLGEGDAFVVIAASDRAVAELAIERVRERAGGAIAGIPEETRDPLPDGRTRYSRPLPGRNRMYPETDVVPVPLEPAYLERLAHELPELPSATRERLVRTHGLGEEMTGQLIRAGEVDRFEWLVAHRHPPALVARLLVHDLPTVAPEGEDGGPMPGLSLETLDELLGAVDRSDFAKEGLPEVLRRLAAGSPSVGDAARAAGLEHGSAGELESMAASVVSENERLVRERGEAAFSPLMGDLMAKARGRYDGEAVARALRAALTRRLAEPSVDTPSR